MSDKTAGSGSGPSQGSPRARFRTSLLATGKNTTGIDVPPEVIERLGAGQANHDDEMRDILSTRR